MNSWIAYYILVLLWYHGEWHWGFLAGGMVMTVIDLLCRDAWFVRLKEDILKELRSP